MYQAIKEICSNTAFLLRAAHKRLGRVRKRDTRVSSKGPNKAKR